MRMNRTEKLDDEAWKSGIHRLSKKVKTQLRNADRAQIISDSIARQTIKNCARDLHERGKHFGITVRHHPDRWPVIVFDKSCRMTHNHIAIHRDPPTVICQRIGLVRALGMALLRTKLLDTLWKEQ